MSKHFLRRRGEETKKEKFNTKKKKIKLTSVPVCLFVKHQHCIFNLKRKKKKKLNNLSNIEKVKRGEKKEGKMANRF